MPCYVDAKGNVVAAPPAGGAATSRDLESGSSRTPFRTVADLQPQTSAAEAGQQPSFFARICAAINFRFRSALGVLVVLQIILFFVSCWIVTPRTWITPDSNALWKIGSNNFMTERCVTAVGGKFVIELRRFFVAIFLHVNVGHILFNILFQVFSAPRALEFYGTKRFICLFLASGACGNLLSAATEHVGVGASTACYGLVGAFTIQFLHQYFLTEDPNMRSFLRNWMLLAFGSMLVWELIQWNTLDHFGHLGGFLSGLCLAVLLAPDENSTSKRRKVLVASVFAVGVLLCIIKIFFWPTEVQWDTVCASSWRQYSL